MSARQQAISYFVAAALFATAGALNAAREGLNIKTAVALIFVVTLVAWGLKALRSKA
jgi:hypothetical protein